MYKPAGVALLALACACSGTNVQVAQVNAATNNEKTTANNVKTYAQSTPPANATSMGMMTSPRAGNTTIPITNVEVFVFTANVDDDSSAETLYWAYDGQTAYVWGKIDLACVDENGAPDGQTGTADFVYEVDPGGWGWMTATDACGYSTLFGCSDDGTGEVCGGCDWNESFIGCVAES